MNFLRRGSQPSTSFVYLRVGSLFAAVALWFVGIRMESDLLRITAMAVAVFALAIGVASRQERALAEEDEDGLDAGEVEPSRR